MIKIQIMDLPTEDEREHMLNILIGGNDPVVCVDVPCYLYEETITSLLRNIVSERSYHWEHQKLDEKDRYGYTKEEKIKEKSKIVKLDETFKKK